jgi:hypothetical protein
MKRLFLWAVVIFAFASLLLSACGGGGGGDTTVVIQPATATITLATSVTGSIPADTIIAGYDIAMDLPAGVTVKSSSPPATDTGVVTPSGTASTAGVMASYIPATNSTPAKLHIIIASTQAGGFDPGEFGIVTCDIAPGYHPAASDFAQPIFSASGLVTDLTGSILSTVDLTSQLALTAAVVIH